jgi:hypothetical protein
MSAPIKHFPIAMIAGDVEACYYTDHLASHQYDEAKERALFIAFMKEQPDYSGAIEIALTCVYEDTGKFFYEEACSGVHLEAMFAVWAACAKARAKAAGCTG